MRGDYRDALGWLQVLEAVGEELPIEYRAKRQAWLRLAAATRGTPGASPATFDGPTGTHRC
jgi:hypothetical protein